MLWNGGSLHGRVITLILTFRGITNSLTITYNGTLRNRNKLIFVSHNYRVKTIKIYWKTTSVVILIWPIAIAIQACVHKNTFTCKNRLNFENIQPSESKKWQKWQVTVSNNAHNSSLQNPRQMSNAPGDIELTQNIYIMFQGSWETECNNTACFN